MKRQGAVLVAVLAVGATACGDADAGGSGTQSRGAVSGTGAAARPSIPQPLVTSVTGPTTKVGHPVIHGEHPAPWELSSARGSTLALVVKTGAEECYALRVEVVESADTVSVAAFEGAAHPGKAVPVVPDRRSGGASAPPTA